MKKVHFLVKNIYNQGGDTRAVVLLANRMAEDHEVTIISFFKTADSPILDLRDDIKIIALFNEPFSLRKNYFKVVRKLSRTIKKCNIDILFIEAIGFNCITYPIIRNKDIKTISCEHASYYDGGNMFGMAWFGRKIACRTNDCVVVLTRQDLIDYKTYMKKIKRIEQIYNPMDVKLKNYPYDLDSKRLITCGRLVHVKGYDYLIEVARKVFSKHPNWEWHIYGEGAERENIEKKIDEFKLHNNVKLMGEIEEIYDKYKEYSAYVMTSRSESFGMVLVEALKSGLPAISFDCNNGPREIIDNNENGLLIECFNTDLMAESICKFIESKELRKKLSSKTQENLLKFDIDNIYQQWINIINSI